MKRLLFSYVSEILEERRERGARDLVDRRSGPMICQGNVDGRSGQMICQGNVLSLCLKKHQRERERGRGQRQRMFQVSFHNQRLII